MGTLRRASKYWNQFCVLVFLFTKIHVTFAARQSGFPFHNRGQGHTHPSGYGESFLDLCDTPEGMSGECHPHSNCWASDYESYDLEPCELQPGHQKHFCCPDRTDGNIRIVSGGRYQRPHQPAVPKPPRVVNPYPNRGLGHDHPRRGSGSILDLCDTPEGMNGECHPHSDCWAADYQSYQLEPCELQPGYQKHFCCPDRTDGNIGIVSGGRYQRPHQPSIPKPPRVVNPMPFPNRGLGHDHPRRGSGSILDLCDTPEGMTGECHPHSDCWAAEYESYDLEPCEMQPGYQKHFCCPDRTDGNIGIVSGGRYQRPHQPSIPKPPRVVNPMPFPNRGLGHDHPRRGSGSILDLCDTPEGMTGECHPHSDCWAAEYESYDLEPCEMQPGYQKHFCCPDRTDGNIRIVSGGRYQRPHQPAVEKPPRVNPMQGLIDTVIKPVVEWLNPTTAGTNGDRYASTTLKPVTRGTSRPGQPRPTRVPGTVKTTTRRPTTPLRTTRRPTTTPVRQTTTRKSVVQPQIQPSCGQRASRPEEMLDERDELSSFVIGGTDAEEYSWPWMVSIHSSRNGARSRFICGGSLITNRHVLTAAHCFESRNQGITYTVHFGSLNHTSNRQQGPSGGQLPVTRIKSHEQYVQKVHYYDIAILTLSRNVIFDENVSPICLPSTQELQRVTAHAKVVLTGWGHTSFGGTQSNRLQEVNLQIIPLSRCQDSYDNFQTEALQDGVTTDMMCAGSPEGGMDACQGDSGGPLVMQTGRRWIQIGIVSFGYRCGVRDYPGVYTRISSYMAWINRVLSEQ